jgi:hypothetical protein
MKFSYGVLAFANFIRRSTAGDCRTVVPTQCFGSADLIDRSIFAGGAWCAFGLTTVGRVPGFTFRRFNTSFTWRNSFVNRFNLVGGQSQVPIWHALEPDQVLVPINGAYNCLTKSRAGHVFGRASKSCAQIKKFCATEKLYGDMMLRYFTTMVGGGFNIWVKIL